MANVTQEQVVEYIKGISVLELSHTPIKCFGDICPWYCGYELLPINKIQQFFSFHFCYSAVGQRHNRACGNQALHHI